MKMAPSHPTSSYRRKPVSSPHALGFQSTLKRPGVHTFIPLCGLRKAMVIPAKAGIQSPAALRHDESNARTSYRRTPVSSPRPRAATTEATPSRHSRSGQLPVQVPPRRIPLLDQFELPRAPPLLDRLFARNRARHRLVSFIPLQCMHPIPAFVNPPTKSLLCSHTRLTGLEVTPTYRVPLRSLARM